MMKRFHVMARVEVRKLLLAKFLQTQMKSRELFNISSAELMNETCGRNSKEISKLLHLIWQVVQFTVSLSHQHCKVSCVDTHRHVAN